MIRAARWMTTRRRHAVAAHLPHRQLVPVSDYLDLLFGRYIAAGKLGLIESQI